MPLPIVPIVAGAAAAAAAYGIKKALENTHDTPPASAAERKRSFLYSRHNQFNGFGPSLLRSVDTLELTERIRNHLKAEDIHYVGDLTQRTENELLQIPGINSESLNEIKTALAAVNKFLKIGEKERHWPPIISPVIGLVGRTRFHHLLLRPIDKLELFDDTLERLKAETIHYIGDLIQRSEDDLLKILSADSVLDDYLKECIIIEIKNALVLSGLRLNTKLENWPPASPPYPPEDD